MLLRFIFYTFVFYIVIKILRMFLDPFFETKEKAVKSNQKDKINTTPQKPIVGEYIEYEEVK